MRWLEGYLVSRLLLVIDQISFAHSLGLGVGRAHRRDLIVATGSLSVNLLNQAVTCEQA